MNRTTWVVTGLLVAGICLIGAVGLLYSQRVATTQPSEPTDEQLLARIDPARATDYSLLRARLVPAAKVFFVGEPVEVEFQLSNVSDEPVLVRLPYQSGPAARPDKSQLVAGLPLSHVFSREGMPDARGGRRALVVYRAGDLFRTLDNEVTYSPPQPAGPIVLRPHGMTGVKLDLARHYPSMTGPGRYLIEWRPYGDAVRSPMEEITIVTREEAIIETSMGDIRLSLFYEKAPRHVENFLDLARRGFYDNTLFHRVIEGFMVQAGDPLTTDPAKAGQWGTGRGPRTLKAEFNDTSFAPGVLGAARGPDVNSASCQFFVVTGKADHLDGQYTAFGRVVDKDSLDVAMKISHVRTSGKPNDRPLSPITIKTIRVRPLTPPATSQPEGPGAGE